MSKFQLRTRAGLTITVKPAGISWPSNWAARTQGAPLEQFRPSRMSPYTVPRDRISMVTLTQSAQRGRVNVILDIAGAGRHTFSDANVYTLQMGKHFNLVEMFHNMGYPVNGLPAQQPAA